MLQVESCSSDNDESVEEHSLFFKTLSINFLKLLKYIYLWVLVLTPTVWYCVPVVPKSLEFLRSCLQKSTRLPLKFRIWMWAFRANLNLKIQ